VKNAPDKTQSQDSTSSAEAQGLGRLLGVIAHEIKNPLSTIKVNLRLIDEELQIGSIGDEQRLARARRKLSIIDKETSRLEQILDNFLRYADQTQPHLIETDLNDVVDDIIDFYMPQAAVHSITLRKFLHNKPAICLLDAGMLKQAILNLLINAQQAIIASGEIMVRTSVEGKFAKLQISDTGKGIQPEKLNNLFEPYQSSRPDGSGLGLATVKKIIDAHNGNISVFSEPDKGTAFTISLPLKV